ncbi:MAG: hypothetical protein JO332_13835 [Planctomycetaceae bacterium]|nr:hypothetical protein [Planctomycetaceae bacterium]
MNDLNRELESDWILDAVAPEGDLDFIPDVDWSEPEWPSLTWDEETARNAHREIAYRARKASSDRLF